MRKYWLAAMVLVSIGSANAQTSPHASHQTTSAIPNARYEIVQSPMAARWTFKLDRYTGTVWQLVSTPDSGLTWEGMMIVQSPIVASSSKPRFQLFTSGIAARHTFLFDTETGRTWQLTTQKFTPKDSTQEIEINAWQPFQP
ncbi:hypothetical protein [Herbaspirillum frisingense]|uniref:Uncharacterized protein n=1 Tax=Herbaspirillum frisingense TaxID=92645 RepID=A0ABU1PKJ6_9BURK|nr:hypothetical protein [Herbaspirillum frisingense]MDR6586357.1 hypothetical protein [Herbaspirillum frisingense]